MDGEGAEPKTRQSSASGGIIETAGAAEAASQLVHR